MKTQISPELFLFSGVQKLKLQNAKIMVGCGRTAKSVHQTKALREIFRMGMVSGVLVFKGFAKVWFFMIFGPFFLTLFDRFFDPFQMS